MSSTASTSPSFSSSKHGSRSWLSKITGPIKKWDQQVQQRRRDNYGKSSLGSAVERASAKTEAGIDRILGMLHLDEQSIDRRTRRKQGMESVAWRQLAAEEDGKARENCGGSTSSGRDSSRRSSDGRSSHQTLEVSASSGGGETSARE